MAKTKTEKTKAPKLVQSSLGLFSEMDRGVFSSDHDEIMCWTDKHLLEIVSRLWPDRKFRKIGSKRWEMPVAIERKRQTQLVGFIDLAVTMPDFGGIYFEIKTMVRPGSDLRQIHAYKFYLRHPTDYENQYEPDPNYDGPFVIVSPDERHAKLLAEQGIKFVKYPDFLST